MLYLQFQNHQWSISNGFQFTRQGVFSIYGDDVKYVARDWQFECIQEGQQWYLIPNSNAGNDTIVNKRAIVNKIRLNDGDVISVGRASKSKYFCETSVRACSTDVKLEAPNQTLGLYSGMMVNNAIFWQSVFGDDCRFISPNQYSLVVKYSDGPWYLNALKGVQNDTLLNGKAVSGKHQLYNGDRISIGNQAKGIEKCVLTFRSSTDVSQRKTVKKPPKPRPEKEKPPKDPVRISKFSSLTRSVVDDSSNELSTINTAMVLKSIEKLIDVREKARKEKQLIKQVHKSQKTSDSDDKSIFAKLYVPVIEQDLQQVLHKTANSLQSLVATFETQTISDSPISLWHVEKEEEASKLTPKHHLRMPPLVVGIEQRAIEEHSLIKPILNQAFIDHQNLAVTGDALQSGNTFQQILSQIALHLPHQVKFTLIDTMNMGRDFPMRNLLGSKNMVTTNVAQHLEDIFKELQDITSQYLVGDVLSFEDLPEALQTDLQYEVIAISNYPAGFDQRQHQLLETICRNGPLAGKFVLFHWNEEEAKRIQQANTQNNSPMGDVNALRNTMVVDVSKTIKKGKYTSAPLPTVSNSLMMTALRRLETIPKPSTILPFSVLPPEQMWQKSSADFVELDLGTIGVQESLRLMFGQRGSHICTHGAIVGAPGMGKSNFFHALICSMAQEYSPDEVQMYLIDGKSGMTFQTYTSLPHARVVVLKSPQETSADVLDRLLNEEIVQRGELFKKGSKETGLSISSLKEYRQAGYSLPRIFLFIDEYAELFSNSRNHVAVSKDLKMLSKQGRAFGLHFILGGHSFGVSGMMEKDEIFKNIELRIAMKVAEESRMGLTNRFGDSARQLSERCLSPGQMLYNDQAGVSSATTFGRSVFVSSKMRKKVINNVIAKASKTTWISAKPFCFSGMDAPVWTDNRQILRLKDSSLEEWSTAPIEEFGAGLPEWEPNMLPLWIGKAMTIYEYATILLKRNRHHNIAIVGEGDAQRFGVVAAMLKSLALFQSKQTSEVMLLNMMSRRTKNITVVVEEILTPMGVNVSSHTTTNDISTALQTLQQEMERRQQLTEDERTACPSLFCVLMGLDKMTSLEKITTKYNRKESSPDLKAVESLLENGATVGIHLVVSSASVNSFKHIMGGVTDKFIHQLIQNIDRHEQGFADANTRETLTGINGYPHPMGYWQTNLNSGYVFKPYEADYEEEWSLVSEFQPLS